MWIKCGDGNHLLNASQVLNFGVEDGTSTTNHSLPDSGVLVVAWMAEGAPVLVGRYETQEHANLVLNTISAAFESGARTLDVHRLRTSRRGADGG